jgi:hypothetical protein
MSSVRRNGSKDSILPSYEGSFQDVSFTHKYRVSYMIIKPMDGEQLILYP